MGLGDALLPFRPGIALVAQGLQKMPPGLVITPQSSHADPQGIAGQHVFRIRQQGQLVFVDGAEDVPQRIAAVRTDVQGQGIAQARARRRQQLGVLQSLEGAVGHLALAIVQEGIPGKTGRDRQSGPFQPGAQGRIVGQQRLGAAVRMEEDQGIAAIEPSQRFPGAQFGDLPPCRKAFAQRRFLPCVMRDIHPHDGQHEAPRALFLLGKKMQKVPMPVDARAGAVLQNGDTGAYLLHAPGRGSLLRFLIRRGRPFLPGRAGCIGGSGLAARRMGMRRRKGGHFQQAESVPGFQRRRGIGQMHGLGHGMEFPHLQEHHFALVLVAGAFLSRRPPDRETHAFAGLGLGPQPHPHPALRQGPEHGTAVLKDAGKGHDARRSRLGGHAGREPGTFHEHAGLLEHGQTQLGAFHVLRVHGMSGAQTGTYGPARQGGGHGGPGHAGQRGLGHLLAGAAAAHRRQQQGHAEAPHTGGHHIRRQLLLQGFGRAAHELIGKAEAHAAHDLAPVGKMQQHQPHAQPVQGGALSVPAGGVREYLAHPGGLVFHGAVEHVLRGKAGDGIHARGLDPGQKFQAKISDGRELRQQDTGIPHLDAMQHQHAQKTPLPVQGQEQTTLARQQFRLARRMGGGEVQGMVRTLDELAQFLHQEGVHVHEVPAGQVTGGRSGIHAASVVVPPGIV